MKTNRRIFLILASVLGAAGLLVNVWIARANSGYSGADYNQFYSASHLVGTGRLYDWQALQELESERGMAVPTGRLPVVLFGHKLLSFLPYEAARGLWMAISVAAVAMAAWLWPLANRSVLTVALGWSAPLILGIYLGQDVPLWLLFFAGGLHLLERKLDTAAGISFALCICKYQLALGIPILLISRKRWKTLASGTLAALGLLFVSALVDGADWYRRYWAMVSMPGFSPVPERMPNLRGLFSFLTEPASAVIISTVALVLVLWTCCRTVSDLGIAGAMAAAFGVMLSYYALLGDCALLVPLIAIVIGRAGAPVLLKAWGMLVLSPVATFLLVSRSPQSQLLIDGFVVGASLWLTAAARSSAGSSVLGERPRLDPGRVS